MPRHEFCLPDLGIDDQPMKVCLWLVRRGARVTEGQPLLEVLAGSAVVDLPSPVSGTLVETLVAEDSPLQPGQCLAVIDDETDEG